MPMPENSILICAFVWQVHRSKNNYKMYYEIDIAATKSQIFSALDVLNGINRSEFQIGEARRQF